MYKIMNNTDHLESYYAKTRMKENGINMVSSCGMVLNKGNNH